jgi:hypothetical protein
MKIGPLSTSSTILLLLPTLPCYPGVCSQQIVQMQDRINAVLDSAAEAGPAADETLAATLHRQPTPKSIAAAEAKIGDLSPETVRTLGEAMARARQADISGDNAVCEQALGDAQRAIGN